MATRIDVDMSALVGLAATVGEIGGARMQRVGTEAVNAVATRTMPSLRDSIVETINLSGAYVAGRTNMRLAQPGGPAVATLTAPFRATGLGRYLPLISTQTVKNPARSKGNPRLGIPAGRKPLVVSVSVTRGSRKQLANPTAFLNPKQRDSDGNPMVFVRRGDGRYPVRALYGPAVYQLFRVARDRHIDAITSDLELELLAEIDAILEETL